jgi:hypothetical protein
MALRERLRRRARRPAESPAAVLRTLLERPADQPITIHDVVHAMGGRSFGVLLFVWAILSVIPAVVPGMSTILGLPLLFLSWQLAWGLSEPWIPKRIAARHIERATIEKLEHGARRFRPIERMLRPRLEFLVTGIGQRLLGVVCIALSLIFILPIPAGNWLPGMGIAIIALAVARRDGAAALVGLLMAAVSFAMIGAIVFGFTKAAHSIMASKILR